MPLFSNSPHKPGTAEDFTFQYIEALQERPDPNAGEATMAVATGLGVVLTQLFRLPRLLWLGLRRLMATGTVIRWTIWGAVIGSLCGVALSTAMHDEIMRAQVRLVPAGIILGFALGLLRRSAIRRKRPA
jgi:hypothetical protein